MAWTPKQIIIAVVMVITGSINTLSTKWADKQYAVGSDGKNRPFDHPFLQAVGMFIGEFSCLLVYLVMRARARPEPGEPQEQPRRFNPLVFLPAAMCDMFGTSIMYIGLNLTYASSFQMLRGAVIIFTALLSVAFLGRVIKRHMWVGILLVLVGLVLVGLSDILFGDLDTSSNDTNGIISGDLLIIMAQVIAAVQMVYEERFIGQYNVHPLACVGWEGFWGALVLGILLIPMSFIDVGNFSHAAYNRLENPKDAFIQMGNNKIIILAVLGNIVSIAFFNFAGVSITKELSATTRMVLDSVRTLIIWVFSLLVQWQKFQYLQIIGFLVLLMGMTAYNNLIRLPRGREMAVITESRDETNSERQRLLDGNSVN